MIYSDATVGNALPASSQNNCLDGVPDGDDSQLDSGIRSVIPALQKALHGSYLGSLADASHRHQSLSSRRSIDLNVRLEVERRLRDSSRAEFHRAKCDIHDGILILSGNVSNFHSKQLAQEIARKVDGVNFIVNRLHVDQSHLSAALQTCVPLHWVGAPE
jgi:hypothetical protein